MAAVHHVSIPTLPDRQLLRFFLEAARCIGSDNVRVLTRGSRQAIAVNVDESQRSDEAGRLLKSKLHSIANCHTSFERFTLNYERVPVGLTNQSTLSLHNNAEHNQPQLTVDQIEALNALIERTVLTAPETGLALFSDPKSFEALIASHHSMLVRLEGTATQVTEEMAAARARLEEEFAKRRSELELAVAERQAILEAETASAQEAILERENAIEQRTKALDDRDHIHARRQLREQITTSIADRLKGAIVPTQTSALGTSVFALCLLGTIVLAWLSYESFRDFTSILLDAAKAQRTTPSDLAAVAYAQSPTVWFLLARGFLASLGSIGFLLYSISWMKSLYLDRLKAHRDLERYSIDLNRASWAVETMMEAKSSAAIPDILVAGLSKGLFEQPSASSHSDTDDALSTLLRASAKAKIGPAGAEFEMNGRGASKLADKIDKP